MADPTGGLLGMPVALLAGSPFTDYLVPGIVLFVLLGLLPLATAVGLLLRPGWGWLRGSGKHLAWLASLMVGVLLIAWILVQMTILRFFLQPILLVQGIAIVGVGLLPVVRGHYSPPAAPQATRPSLR